MSPLLDRWLRKTRRAESVLDTTKEDEWGGHQILESLSGNDSKRMRIVFGNINGLQLGAQGRTNHKLKAIFQEIRHLEIDHLGLVEINCDTCNFEVVDCIRSTAKAQLRHVVIRHASTSLKANTAFKPGGTLSLANDDITGRILETGKDWMGRWSFIKYRGKGRRVLTVISAYQVCVSTSDSGTTAYSQQEVLLRRDGKSDTNPRRNFRKDLGAFLGQCKSKGDSIILMGDFNEDLVKNDWITGLLDVTLVDVIAFIHPQVTNITTYQGGKTRLDYAFVTQDILHSITECGYFPFRSHFQSDHRFLYLDVDLEQCLGSTNVELGQPALRDFTAKDPQALRLYIKEKSKYLEDHNFFPRLTMLQENDNYDPTLLEQLDAVLTKASLVAGNRCRRKRRHWFSLPLHLAIEKKMVLQTMLTGFKKAKDPMAMRRVAENRLLKVNIAMALPNNVEEVKMRLKEITKEIKGIVKDSKGARQKFLEDKAEEMARKGKVSHQKALENLLKGEKQAEQWSRIRRALKSDNFGAISSIDVPESWPSTEGEFLTEIIEDPKKCSQWRNIATPKEIEFYIRMRNRLHFGQAQGTPFTVPPLCEYIDWAANSKVSEMILKGDFQDDELAMLEQMLIRHCVSESEAIIGNEITEEEFKARIRVWDESTTSSPSGLHLGHAKALITPIHWATDDDEDIIDAQSALFHAHLSIINYALKHGHSLNRWKSVVNVMIEKEKGNVRIHRLRVIHLYEFDFGAVLGILWKKMMKSAEGRGTINDGQFGGRKGREAKDLAFLEELKTDVCYGSRKPLINFDNDAASCYDRIVPSLASLIARSKGLHYHIAMVHAKTLELAKFKLKTALGVSEDEYSHCSDFPIYGTGQGSTNSPIIWTIISSKLFDLHKKQAHGATFASPDRKVEVSFSIVGFVDDSNCQTNKFLVDPDVGEAELVDMAEHDARQWSKLLWLSGGYLEIQKCSYHLIEFEFNDDGSPVMKGGKVGRPISIFDEQLRREVSIPGKSVYDPHKTLGHYKAPAGKCQTQATVLHAKADELAACMMRFPCTNSEAQMTYRAMYLGWASYSLGQCILGPKDLQRIESKVSQAFMVKCGYARTMPLAIRYGPRWLGGVGQVRLATIQGEGQIQNFVKHWRANSTPGKVAQCAVAWGQLQAGIGESILLDTKTELPHLEMRLLKSMRGFLASIDASLELNPTFVPPLLRENDFFIMDFAISSRKFTPKQLRLINYSRMHLQVTTCSEIAEPGGRCLERAAMSGHVESLPSKTRLLKFHQSRPKDRYLRPWKYLCFMMTLRLREKRLGRWIGAIHHERRQWTMYFVMSTRCLWVLQEGKFHLFTEVEDWVFCIDEDEPAADTIPTEAVPVKGGVKRDGCVRVDPEGLVGTRVERRVPVATTFEEYVLQLPEWEKELLSNVYFAVGGPFQTYEVVTRHAEDSDNVLMLVGDGSGGNGSMSFGWTLSLHDGSVLVEGSGPAHGAKESSYRSERYAFLSAIRFVIRWKIFCNINPKWKFVYFADNESILQMVKGDLQFSTYWPNTTLESEWDVRNEIRQSIKLLGCAVEVKHVKGHQDDHKAVEELSTAAQLNIRADELAGNFRRWNNHVRPSVPRLESNGAQLSIGGVTITGNYRKAIRDAASEKALVQYTMEKFHWSDSQYRSIDWDSFSAAVTSMPHRAAQITKMIFEWSPTYRLIHKYDSSVSPLCPRCKNEIETVPHVIRCHQKEVAIQRGNLIKNLRAKGHALQTKPALLSLLVTALQKWFKNELIEWSSYPTDMQELIRNQTMVGWDQLLRGRFVKEWAWQQECYLGSLPKRVRKKGRSGRRWVTAMIRVIWAHYFEIWEARNQVVHGANHMESMMNVKRKLLRELQMIHGDRLRYMHEDRRFLIAETAEDDYKLDDYVKSHYPTTIRNWLDWHVPIFKESMRVAQQRTVAMVRPITDFFSVWTKPGQMKQRRQPISMSKPPEKASAETRSITEFFSSVSNQVRPLMRSSTGGTK